ncbi:MAG TPA: bifunctional riboflavin kinase/FAD synthetase [Pyrinomonadaceae bacterium]|nr:bifunctional riboflavin kinase/FAD synthetase [Pyrinomonadaceae bacterium]
MKIFHGTENARILRPIVLTLGVFDGLHLGHQKIMATVVERARAVNAVPTAITFDPHPRAVLQPENAPPLLQTLDQRLNALEVLGIEQTIIIRFNRDFASNSAEEFLRDIVFERLQAREIYLGKGFAFGRNRSGNIDLLRKLSAELGFFADEVDEVTLRGNRISSSRIRQLLSEGKVNLARAMLGRPYGVEGRVVRGNQRGRTIGFPTANLQTVNRVVPRSGVYVTATLIENAWRRSITNVGVRPTFENQAEPTIETYVIDWEGDLYGDVSRVRFLHRIRDERKFGGIEELKTQIGIDLKKAVRYFERAGVRHSLNII